VLVGYLEVEGLAVLGERELSESAAAAEEDAEEDAAEDVEVVEEVDVEVPVEELVAVVKVHWGLAVRSPGERWSPEA
jgi:hypothetical protein